MSNGKEQDLNKGWQPQDGVTRGYQPVQQSSGGQGGGTNPGYQPETQGQDGGGASSNSNPPGAE